MQAVKIKNYTSSVPVERTLSVIERELVSIGATSIQKDYKDGQVTAVFFSVNIPSLGTFKYRVPARADSAVKHIASIPQYARKGAEWQAQQAQRTAWRIVHDWIISNCAMIRLEQAEAMQVFLPYVVVDKRTNVTLYTRLKSDGMMRHKLLGSPE